MNPLKKARPGGDRLRNLQEASQRAAEMVTSPIHQRKKTPYKHLHPALDQQNGKNKMFDPYSYMHNNLSSEEEQVFLEKENGFFQMSLLRSDLTTKQLWREQDYYKYDPSILPIRIDDHIYYRRMDNMADSMTLYRFPIDQLTKWHDLAKADHDELLEEAEDAPTPRHVNSLMGEIPPYPYDPDLNDRLNFKQKEEAKMRFEGEYPEQKVFCLKDLQRLYDSYA